MQSDFAKFYCRKSVGVERSFVGVDFGVSLEGAEHYTPGELLLGLGKEPECQQARMAAALRVQ